MCGIFAVINDPKKQAATTTLDGLKKLEYRGYDSWGIAIIPQDRNILEIEKHIGKIGQAETKLPSGSIAIGHTRWATHGGVTDNNAHPHTDCSGRIAVIHNGIVENHQELKSKLLPLGHIFVSETDTEVIAHLIEEESKRNSFSRSVFNVFNSLIGSNAIVAIDSKTKTVVACRNGSPLVIGVGENQSFLSSDVSALLRYTSQVKYLTDGEGVEITVNSLVLRDLKSFRKKPIITETINWREQEAEKNGYPHYLLKEILEQSIAIPKTVSINKLSLVNIGKNINYRPRVVIIGCGSAYYCGLTAKYFLSQVGIESQVFGAYEFLPFAHFCNNQTTCLVISQSGETADTLIATKIAKSKGAGIVAVVNTQGSTLENLSDITLNVNAGPEIAVVSTKAFTSQLSTLYLLAQTISGKLSAGQNKIIKLASTLHKWLNPKFLDSLLKLSKQFLDQEDIFIVGKHSFYPIALEFALKIKETSYIHAEAFSSGELKHGVITLIQKGTPCFVLVNDDDTRDEVLSSAAQLKARGAYIVGISAGNSPEFDKFIKIPRCQDLSVVPAVIVGQLLGYFLGVGRGADPDKPRNLAKSVTVK